MREPKYINADDAIDYLKGWVYPSKRDKKFVEAIIKFLDWFPAEPVRKRTKTGYESEGEQ